MSELLRRLDALSPRRRALLTLRLVRRAAGASPVQDLHALPIRPLPRNDGEAFLLSFAQERLWFFDRLESRRGVYNMAYAVPVGAACPGRLGRSLDETVRRHDVLRAVFPPGEPRQQVLPFRPRPLPVVDLSGLPARKRDAEQGRLRQEEGERPFDLARGPLLRTSLLRLSADESVLLVNFHHMVSDGWSMWVLMAEVAAAYQGDAPLAELPVQYADFAAWQREVLGGGTLGGLTAFWRQTLAGVPGRLELPADRPRPPVQSFRGSTVPFSLRSGEAIAALCRSRGATLFMVLLAAFQALLRCWSGQEELVVGAVAANRGRSDVEGLIGCFVNTLALPARMPAGTTFDGLLAQVRTVALGGYAHQDLPFEKLVDELKVERSLAWSPLVQVMFVLQNTPAERHRLAGRELHPEEIHSGTSKLDLTLSVTEGDLSGFIEYATDLFDGSTIRRMAACFETLLAAALAAPGSRLEDLTLLPEAESHQLLAEWNDTALARAEDPCLHELIEAQVDRTPDAIAVIGGIGGIGEEETLTYRQLDRRANALAWRLRSLGVGPDTLVGIAAERSPAMIVGLLAILKAGGGYVPLDPEYPAERLAFMLEDSAVPVLLAQPHLSDRFPRTVVPLAGDEEDGRRPVSQIMPESAAYAIYTSGSTGRPKGAVNSHHAIVNRLLWMQEEYGLDASDRVLQKTPFSFDVSVWELFWPLLAGARLVFARPGGHRDASYLVDRIAAEGITTLHFVPSMLQVFLEERGLDRCGSLRRVVASGEALPPDLADRFARRLGPLGARLHNLYGPTEAAVDVTFRPCPGGERRVPIGRPIANLRIHVLDREGRPAPVGVPGELNIGGIGGAGLARGYLRRPELTAERFVPDPLGLPGERLYRTGDLARHLPSGEIEYLGRLDHQVKIRGVRIELGEIEAVLAEHPAIREAMALARDGSLAAFLVLREAVPVADLRAWARERLPEALVPSAWAVLDALPLTPNGKADRKALSAMSLQPAEGAAWAPPRTPLEELLAGLWEELLGLERAGIHDRFFDLGGHSLLATRLIGRLGARLGIDVPLRAVFAAPTPAALAAWLEEARQETAPPPVRPVPRDRTLPLSFAQERIWFLERLEPGQAAYNIPFAWRLEGSPDVPDLERRLTAIVRRHEALRTVFRDTGRETGRETGGEPRQEILPPGTFSLPVIDLQDVTALDRLLEDEVRRPFDLSAEAPLRARLIRLDGRTSVLLFNLHHAAGDGWSLEILAEELGAVAPLPELPVQYADFAAWQREWLSGEVLERQVGWWREELAGAPALLELPADRPRPPLQAYRGSSLDFALPAELAAAVKAFSRRQGATAFMVLFAAFQALLHRLTGQEDLLVGTVVANRRRAEVEGLIGLFVNTLVLRGRTQEEEGFGSLVERARSTALGVYAHQDLPFERLIEELGVPRSLACSPLFQVMFTLESAPRRPLALPGVEAAPFPLPSFTSKFDLTLYLTESEGGLTGTLEYASGLFDRATVHRLAGQLRELLAGALANPVTPVADLPLLTEAERRQLRDWSAGPADEPTPVHRAFEEQARRTPDVVAVVCGGESLTYAELDLRAGRLARHLRDLGAGPDVLVGIALERSADMLVAVLGVLKSGAAWLPLDPSHPRERLAAILEDARPPLLIGDLESGARRVRLDEAHGEPLHSQHDEEALPDHLAYAIFTSGSTGRPKGVLVRRGALANFLASMRRAPGLSSDDVLLAVTTLSFDISVLELLLPLLVGGRVVIARRDEAADPLRLRALLDESGATVLQATPATWRMLLDAGWPGSPGLRALCGGEALPVDLARQLLGRVGSLWNLYGPTETTVWSAASEVRLDRLESASVPIQGPVDRTALVLVDRRLQPVPPGVPGEILIGGEGLARGYLGRPDLTAERFVPDPFGEPGARAYRTGDLARRRPSGEIDFLGRIDNQVKLRGFRIELGEIEAALAAHPAVREAVVLARGSAGDRTLEAFLVLDGEAPGLPGFLRARLPEYMVPSAWTVLESLPLNANGKVDRRVLAALERRDAVSAEPSALPRTSAEELLAGIWADVLGRERVGTRDSFFDLGGHSLLGSRVLARVANAFGVDLPLRALFEAPTVAALAERIETAGRRRQAPPIVPIPRGGDLPLSFAQERLWVLDRLQPGGSAYNVFEPYRLRGFLTPAHREALARALEEIVARHEALRAVFPEKDGAPVQVVLPPAPRPLPEIDLRAISDRQEEAARLLDAELRRPFDLARGPLLRATLLRVTDDEALLAVSLHHIVSDGWSLGVLADELSTLGAAFLEGRPSPPPLAPLPVQYADYAAWQRGWLQGEALDEQLAWWKQELAGLPALLELPADRPRPAVWSDRLGSLRMDLSPELAQALRDLSRRRGATLFMTLLAGFQALLHRLTGRDDVPVGTPVAGRVRPELEGLIGLFVNTLALRIRMPRTFEALLGSIRATSLEAFARQDVPFEKLVEELRLPRSLSHNPLFQVLLAYQNVPAPGLRLPGVEAAPLEVGSAAARLDLSLIFFETPEGLAGLLEYASALFDAPTAGRVASALRVLLEAAAADPGLPLSDLPLLSPAERLQLAAVGTWDGTAWRTAPELFEAVAARWPDEPAVLFDGGRLTYGELRGRVERLARRLRARGVGRETIVALFLDRSPELIATMLGVLRAGGAYLALDPEYPAERIRLALEDSGATIVLSGQDLADGPEEAGEMPWPDPGDLAYILYTSGSTGQPKGVLVEHRGIPNLVEVQARFFDVRPGDRVLQFASPSFDASVSEIWTALGTGATLVMATRDDLLPGPRLVRRMREQGVTHVTLAPSLLAALPPPESIGLPDLRTVVVAGEACPPELARRWAATRRVVNGYGPTEGTVCATLEDVAATGPMPERLSIGRPVARIRVYVLDRGLEPLPDGFPGELCLGSIGLARGYHGRPDLTAERFVPDPFTGPPGARIYRSGDLVRRLPDGRLEFLGRIDHQIKLRGLRIEPGEIEAALLRQPGVRECVVLVRGEAEGRRLVAFAAPPEGAERPSPSELREALARELPAHLVPSAVVLLDALPLTPNGKVDRQALVLLEADPAATTVHVAPRTPTEAGLAPLWADLLGVERVGVHDVFFELGGHSLLGIRLLARVADRFGVELPLRALFEAPALAALAARIDSALAKRGMATALPPIVPVPREGRLPLSFSQERLWFLDRLLADRAVYNLPLWLGLSGRLDRPALERTLAEIVRRHEVLRTTFPDVGGEPWQEIHAPGPFPLPETDLRALPPERRQAELERLQEIELREPFDLGRGPLIRARLLRLEDEESALLLTMHHIVSDGWSVGVLLQEMLAASPLPGLPIQFADFAAWQRSWLQGEALESQMSFWTRELAGAPTRLELPTDRPRPAVVGSEGGERMEPLPDALAGALRVLARKHGATLFMVLLAGVQTLLHRLSGQDDLLLGSPFAGRDRPETEGLIGFFVNTLVLRGRMPAGTRFRDLVERARATTLSAYAHQDLPFEKLVEELRIERSLSHTPLFQVLFTFQEAMPGTFELPGLVLRPLPVGTVAVKFDLTLALAEIPGGGIAATVRYLHDLFDAPTPARFLEQLRTLLEGAAADPDRPLATLPLLPESERHQMLREWNDTVREAKTEWTVVERFEEWVERTPDAPALAFEGEVLSYRELAERTGRLAARLREMGVGPEVPVAVCLERSLAMMEAVLGVLRAGGAYVPIDPDFPAERIAFIVEDSGARIVLTEDVLTEESLRAMLEDPSPTLPCFAGEGATTPGGGTLAYLIYTSGSTGRPKGVAVEHRQLASYLDGVLERMALPPGSSYATVSTLAADLGNTVVYAALATGGCLHIISRERLADGEALGEYFERHGIDCLKIVPSHLAALLASSRPASCLPRRLLVVGGESTRRELAGRIRELAPACRLLNHYGPTETTVGVLTREIDAYEPGRSRQPNIPLGRPIRGTRIALLDRNGEPVPMGVPGELHVGGDNVTRGYLGRPDLTAARFVPESSGARLYATGDLARRRPDGVIEFLGRVDHQVKIRGYRVELGEIEAALAAHPDVQGAAVLAREVASGDLRLVAFVAPQTPRDLASWLRERLPDAMVPAIFVPLESLPLTPNGKVDRRALEALAVTAGEAPEVEDGAPRTPSEEIVAGIFADLLGLERVGHRGHFFDLGGHSLLATRALSRLRDAFEVELSLRVLFEAPTVAGLAARIEEALADGKEILAPPIRPVSRDGDLPLSFAQERLWLLDRLEPGRAVYNVPLAVRISGPLDLEALERSLAGIVRRHEVLRSRFPEEDGRPVQQVLPFAGFSLPRVDLRGLPDGSREALRIVEEEARRPFELGRGPLLRAAVLLTRDTPEEAVLSLHLHHIVSDGWSRGLFLAELSALYAGRSLPELPVQYADFAAWQREWLRGDVLERQIAFWKVELDGAPRLLELPSDRPRPAAQSFRGGRRTLELPAGTARGVRDLARRQGATLFMTLLAAWQALLGRLSGQDDVLVGTPVSGRNRSEIEGLIGFFVNTLVLRGGIYGGSEVVEGSTFRDLVGHAKTVALSAYAHQELPFERLVEELSVQRSLSHNPLFQVMFSLEDQPSRSGAGLDLSPVDLETGTAKFDLGLAAAAGDGRLDLSLEYAADLFDPATAERMLGWLATFLACAIAEPDARVAELPLLGAGERQQFLREWNDSFLDTSGPLVHHQVEAWAARLPDAEAVEGISYGELSSRANRLAHHLRRLGVRPESKVGILLERSPDLIVAELAVLKAGGAFVPLDASHPVERLAFTLEDSWRGEAPSDTPVLLARESLIPDGLRELGARILPPESWESEGDPASDPEPWATDHNLAYVIYTSGSTGRPKGVEIEHASLRNLTSWHRGNYGVTPADRASLVSSPAFDASVWEVWPYLVSGASLRIPHEEIRTHPGRLVSWLAGQGITMGFLSAPVAEAAWAEPWPAESALRIVFTGADKVHQGPPPGLRLQLVNAYGPTEATVVVTAYEVAPGEISPPIGRPFAGARVILLDSRLQPVPLGVPGELCVAGPNLARGYAGRPGLTAERFIPDPFEGSGARLYRTGDLARWRIDGNLEYLGRIDLQVKIRGYRIELGEVESALGSHPGLRAAAVLAVGTTDRRLVAYVVPADAEIPAAELRSWLAERLPEPMVPSAWVTLPELPLTSNGKVDRRALARIEPEPAEEVSDLPATPIEEILCALWSELLQVERVGTGANFFDLGGHSLKATQLVSRVASTLGVDLPVRAVFETPTVAALAVRIDELRLAGEGLQAPPIRPVPREQALPLSYNQEPIWFLHQMDPNSVTYNVFTPLRLQGELDETALLHAVREVVRRHESLRTVFEVRGGVPLQRVLPPSGRASVVDLWALPGETAEAEARRLAGEEGRRSFDLIRGPVFRATLVRIAPASALLLLNAHHIVTDGWSSGILLRELSALYSARVSGGSPGLSELPVQYADFAVWQREWLRGEVLERQVASWRKALAGAPPLIAMPTDRPRPARPTFRGGVAMMVIPEEVAGPLREASRRLGSTLFMTCLAAYQLLLHRYTGQDDVVVGTPVANRGRSETEEVIGCFINTLALRGRLDRPETDLTFRELLARVRATALDAYVHQDLPFEKVVEVLKVERNLRWNPVFQVFFSLSPPMELPSMAGLRLEALDEDTQGAKFDLALGLAEVGTEIWGGIRYSADLFDAATIEIMLARYRALLEQAAVDPDRPLAELAPWSDAERRQILAEPEEKEEALESRLASQGQKVEDLRAHLSDAKKAMLVKLIQGKKGGKG